MLESERYDDIIKTYSVFYRLKYRLKLEYNTYSTGELRQNI